MISITEFGHEAAASLAFFQSSSSHVFGSFFKETTPVSIVNRSGAIDAHNPQLKHLSVCNMTFISGSEISTFAFYAFLKFQIPFFITKYFIPELFYRHGQSEKRVEILLPDLSLL